MSMNDRRLEVSVVVSQIISAIAVVASVAYLAIQIDDNTRALKNQGHFNAMEMAQRPVEFTIENAEVADIVVRGLDDPESLTPNEWYRFSMYLLIACNAWEYLCYANISEAIPESLWIGADAYYRDLVTTKPGMNRFWSESDFIYAEPFNSYVDELFKDKR